MGLPIWRSSSPVESKAALKADLTAAARSPIRRGATLLDSVVQSSIRRAVHEGSEGPPPYSPQSPRSQTFREHRQSQWREREAARRRRAARLVEIGVASEREAANEFTDAGITLRPDLDDHAPPPVPESRNYLRRDTPRTAADDQERLRRVSAAIRTQQDRRRDTRARISATYDERRRQQGLTDTPDAFDNTNNAQEHPRPGSEHTDSPVSGYRPALLPGSSGLPPLRPMFRRSIVDGPRPSSSLRESWSPATTVESARMDGLGDRERSVTPERWDTMLTTIHADPHLPSTDSSFTSAAASASFSNSHPSSRSGSRHSGSSSRTQLTVPSTHDPTEVIVGVCETSDEDEDSSDSNSEREQETHRNHHPLMPGAARRGRSWMRQYNRAEAARRRNERSSHSTNSAGPSLQTPVESTQHRDFDQMGSLFRTISREVNEQNALRPAISHGPSMDDFPAPLQDSDFEQFRPVLEQMARRADIPDDFWMSVGLTPNMARNVNRTEASSRTRAREESEEP